MLAALSFLLLTQIFYLMGKGTSTENLTAKNVLMFTIQNVINMSVFFVVAISLIESFTKTKLVKKIFLNTKEIATISEKEFNTSIDFMKIRKSAINKILLLLFFIVITHGFLLFFGKNVVITLVAALPMFFLALVVVKFSFHVNFMVNSQLRLLLKLLENLLNDNATQNINILSIAPAVNSSNVSRKLLALKKIYNLVFENGALINGSNGLSMLLLLVLFVSSLTVSGYEIFIMLIDSTPKDQVVSTIYSVVYGISFLFEAVTCCHRTCNIVSVSCG